MNMPGFTAEVSLHKTNLPYQFAADQAEYIGDQVLAPQKYLNILESDDGHIVLVCEYTDRGEWLNCDVYFL